MLLTWDFFTGTFGAKPVVFNDSEETALCQVIHVTFSDGTDIGIITEHGFFDLDLGQYVYLDENAAQYIGHRFIRQDGSVVTLENVTITTEYTACFSPITYGDLCYYADGMLSVPAGITGLINIFDVDVQSMRYDGDKMQADIARYGLMTPDEFELVVPDIMFDAFNGQYIGVALGKGLISLEDITYLVTRYAPLCEQTSA